MDLVELNMSTEAIDFKDCRQLLAGERIGRLGVVVDGRPEIFPVNYGMDGDGIVFRTNQGRKMLGLSGEVVFEVDRIDPEGRSGWSVVVHGRAEDITHFDGPRLRERAETPWSGPKDILVRISPLVVTGRRVHAGPLPPS
ncbi:MAG: pyridoxamine 5'-phosphate oxidase family protein [Acidimicrobiales bacterium]|jgi:nitroimidazol reductase NimA-like FMN-containing flavoprotein (pyridoxamine 5'-phosphate oxidase superfamily)